MSYPVYLSYMRRFLSSFLEVAEVAIVAIGAVFLIRNFLIQPFLVSGASMVPTFAHGDYLLIDELTYRLRNPERGEVVVFRYPANRPTTYFIKRIIGLPGERVSIAGEVVTVYNAAHPEGLVLDERYLGSGVKTAGGCGKSSFELLPGEYLVFGDNRSQSFDSRCWGPMQQSQIIGLVRLRLWPPKSAEVFAAPNY